MTKQSRLLFWLTILILPALACNLTGSQTADAAATLNPLYTAAAQTLEAMASLGTTTPGSFPPVDAFATTTPTLSFENPSAPQSVNLCHAAAFIKDVTIPDGSVLTSGTAFTKTWRLKNVGTCSWSTSYALVFVNGDGLNGPTSVNLSKVVNPGDLVDLSVNLNTPTKSGHYRGFWKLRTNSGVLFGIGTQADTAFWVDINVSGPEFVAYDFVARACEAAWKYNNGSLPCPGMEEDDRGYVIALSSPRMEDGTIVKQPGLLTVPKHTANGFIQGRYPAMKIYAGDHFLAKVNCQYKANTCDVLFRLDYRIGNSQIKTFKEWHEVYEGDYYPVDLDLSALSGENVRFFLTVLANNSKGKDYGLWLSPRIVRQGTPPPTQTASKTPTNTPTPTSTTSMTPTPTMTDTPTATP